MICKKDFRKINHEINNKVFFSQASKDMKIYSNLLDFKEWLNNFCQELLLSELISSIISILLFATNKKKHNERLNMIKL